MEDILTLILIFAIISLTYGIMRIIIYFLQKYGKKEPIKVYHPNISLDVWCTQELIIKNKINHHRVFNRINPVQPDTNLKFFADRRCRESMREEGYNIGFPKVEALIKQFGLSKCKEIIGIGNSSIDSLITYWVKEPIYRDVVLGDWDYIGVSFRQNNQGVFYYNVLFSKL